MYSVNGLKSLRVLLQEIFTALRPTIPRAAADETQDLDAIPVLKALFTQGGPVDDVQIQFNGDPLRLNIEFLQKIRYRAIRTPGAHLSINLDMNGIRHRPSSYGTGNRVVNQSPLPPRESSLQNEPR
jgi:hypothetical protein